MGVPRVKNCWVWKSPTSALKRVGECRTSGLDTDLALWSRRSRAAQEICQVMVGSLFPSAEATTPTYRRGVKAGALREDVEVRRSRE